MGYYLAPSLDRLRSQIDALWPNRDKATDGWIGDPSHAARPSDHNPDYSSGGVVRAIDVDKDGIDTEALIECVTGDSRVAYVIWNRRIWGYKSGWRAYTGSNPHTAHMHVSIKHTTSAEDDHVWALDNPEDDMTEDELLKALNRWCRTEDGRRGIQWAVFNQDGVVPSPDRDEDNPYWMPRSYLEKTYRLARSTDARLAAQDAALAALAAGVGMDPDDVRRTVTEAVDRALEDMSITLSTEE